MGFMSSIFGDSDSESESRMEFWGPTRAPLTDIVEQAGGAIEEAQRAIAEGLPDDFVADLNDRQRASIDNLYGSQFLGEGIQQSQDIYNQGGQFANQGGGTLQGFADGTNQQGIAKDIFDQVYNEDLVQSRVDAVGSDIARNLSEGDLLNIDRQYFGDSGNSRAGVAEGIAIRGGQEALAGAATNIRNDAYNQATNQAIAIDQARKQAQMGAGSQLLQTGVGQQQYGLNTGATLGQQQIDNQMLAGNIQQSQDQAEIQGGLDRMNTQVNNAFQPLMMGQQLLMPMATAGGTSFTEGSGPSSGMLGGIMSMAGGAASMAK